MPIIGGRGAGVRGLGFQGAGTPAQVTGLTATNVGSGRAFNNGRIDLSWSAPANNGAPITGYRIERSINSGSTWSDLVANTGTTSVSYSDTGLTSAQRYDYRISAINAVGTGTASSAQNATATTVPQTMSAPTASNPVGVAYTGTGQTSVSFVAPATGGASITGYTVTSSSGLTGTGATSPITVSGETLGVPRTYTIRATNANGPSVESAASNSSTPSTISDRPTGVSATAGNAQATVSFLAPANNGGAVITSYIATSSPGGFTATGAGSPLTVTGLNNGTPYTFTVSAVNSNGTSAASTPPSNSVTPQAPYFGPTTWTSIRYDATTRQMAGFANNGSTWHGITGGTGATLFRSTNNGAAWTTITDFGSSNTSGVQFGNNLWVVGLSGGASAGLNSSTDGTTWTNRVSGITVVSDHKLAYGNGVFLQGILNTGAVRRSTDGITWTTSFLGVNHSAAVLKFGNNVWIAGLYNGAFSRSTDNGSTWGATVSSNGFIRISGMTYGNGIWLAYSQNNARRSVDAGITWTTVAAANLSINSANITAIEYGNGWFFITGQAGQSAVSTDGLTWTSITTLSLGTTFNSIIAATYGNGVWMGGGSSNWIIQRSVV